MASRSIVAVIVAVALFTTAAEAAAALSTSLVSKRSDGRAGHGDFQPTGAALSGNGRFITFCGVAGNFPGNDDTYSQCYVRDREGRTTKLVSKGMGGAPSGPSADASDAAISANGRFVAFRSSAANLPGHNGYVQVYVDTRRTGHTLLVSRTTDGAVGDGATLQGISLSSDGRRIVFGSQASNFPGAEPGIDHVYVFDRGTKHLRLVDRTSDGTPADADSGLQQRQAISADGRKVVFGSAADNLPGMPSTLDVYVRDVKSGSTHLVSRRKDGDPANNNSVEPTISLNGRFAVFRTDASNLPHGDGSTGELYRSDLRTHELRLVSVGNAGNPANQEAYEPVVSGNGTRIVFSSDATNLPGNDDPY